MKLKIYRVLDDIKDRTFVYSVLLNKAQSHYGGLKTLFKIPIIITSSVMSIINSNFTTDDDAIRLVNITFDLLTALTLSLGATLKLEEKHQNFLNAEKKFLKLQSLIEQKLIDDTEISADFINTVMNLYDNIVDGIDYDIPAYIMKNVRDEYKTKKTLPLLINGVNKLEGYRNPDFNDSLKTLTIDTPVNSIVPSVKKTSFSPKVIVSKPFVYDVPIDGLQECV